MCASFFAANYSSLKTLLFAAFQNHFAAFLA
jgi:hypothetical protein